MFMRSTCCCPTGLPGSVKGHLQLFRHFAKFRIMDLVFDALAHPTRRRILEMLQGGGMTAGELADAFPVSKPTMSGHFAKLRAAGLIQGENQGGTIIYTL